MAKGTATKRDPKKWAAAKARAKAKMGGKHSARAMQLAVKYYKDSGGYILWEEEVFKQAVQVE